jgi:hypothetical protein
MKGQATLGHSIYSALLPQKFVLFAGVKYVKYSTKNARKMLIGVPEEKTAVGRAAHTVQGGSCKTGS